MLADLSDAGELDVSAFGSNEWKMVKNKLGSHILGRMRSGSKDSSGFGRKKSSTAYGTFGDISKIEPNDPNDARNLYM